MCFLEIKLHKPILLGPPNKSRNLKMCNNMISLRQRYICNGDMIFYS